MSQPLTFVKKISAITEAKGYWQKIALFLGVALSMSGISLGIGENGTDFLGFFLGSFICLALGFFASERICKIAYISLMTILFSWFVWAYMTYPEAHS